MRDSDASGAEPSPMSTLIELIFAATDPVTALLLGVLIYHVRKIETRLSADIRRVRGRVERLEAPHIPDAYDFDFSDSDHDHDHDPDRNRDPNRNRDRDPDTHNHD